MDENILQYLNWQNSSMGSFAGLDRFKNNAIGNNNYMNDTFKGISGAMQPMQPLASQPLNSNKLDPMTMKTPGKAKNSFGFNLRKGANKVGGFIGNNAGAVGDIASMGSAMVGSDSETSNATTDSLNSAYDMTANALAAIPVWGTAASAIMKVGGFASDSLNKITDGATTIENATLGSDKVLSSKFLSLTPIGLANSLSKKTIEGSDQDLAKGVNMGYTAANKVGKTDIGGVSRFFKKAFTGKDAVKDRQGKVTRANTDNAMKFGAINNNRKNLLASSNSTQDIASKNRQSLVGNRRTNILAAKQGTKLSNLKNIKKNVLKRLEEKKVNVIPSGALHARKNNLPKDIAKHVTHKGIPVISNEEKGEIVQHAEIEHSEIIFHKELTTKLEALYKKDTDEAAIEAGKLLVVEILENTKDNTDLINTIQ